MKRLFTTLLVMLMVVSSWAEIASGTCGTNGDNIKWTLSDDYTLTLSGSGEMQSFRYIYDMPFYRSNAPWISYKNEIMNVIISESITSVADCAFYGCTNLTSVAIPNSVTSIGISAFRGCSSLTSITIPNSVTSIGAAAFLDCSSLTSIEIPNPVTSISEDAFESCSSLSSITIPNSVTSIGALAFRYCSSLTSIEIPNSVTSIGMQAFLGCSLTSITIPNSVTSIGGCAFNDGLREIHCNNPIPPKCTDNTCFSNISTAYCKLYVPIGSKDDYAFAVGWGNFINIIEEEVIIPTSAIAKPTITYENKSLHFASSTEGVKYIYSIKAEDNTTSLTDSENGDVSLSATYTITAYAKKDTETSEASTATLVWATGSLIDNPTTEAKSISIDSTPLLITQNDGIVTVSGLENNDTITAYSTDGTMVATSNAIGSSALMNLSGLRGKVAVLSVNGKTAKVAIK